MHSSDSEPTDTCDPERTTVNPGDTEPLTRVVIVGHVDHGKSTIIGRLLRDTGHLGAEAIRAIEESGRARGMRTEWAFALDALQAERDQGLTIDVSQAWFKTENRRFCLIDAPGHKEFLKNMVTGASSADAALLVVDAEESVRDQTRRHLHLIQMLGLDQIAVIVNKMDRVDWSQARFNEVTAAIDDLFSSLELERGAIIPACATDGDNLAQRGKTADWYDGPRLVDALDEFRARPNRADLPLRLPLQDVYKFDDRRLFAGRIESGSVHVGDEILFSPCNKMSVVASIESFPTPSEPAQVARAGESIMLTLQNQVFVQRGELISHADQAPERTNTIDARIFWLGSRKLEKGSTYRIKLLTQDVDVEVQEIFDVIDAETLDSTAGSRQVVQRNEVANLRFRARQPVALDRSTKHPTTGRFVVVDRGEIAGGGLVQHADGPSGNPGEGAIKSKRITWSEPTVSREERESRAGHRGAVIWLTGLSSSGKSSVARELDRQLFATDCRSYVLDGDNVRHGLNRDLGFSRDDRAENIRRIGEVAKLFAESGTIVLTAFISPYRSERHHARSLCDDIPFIEVFLRCPLDVCESRDTKGLYQKARSGLLQGFTGIDAPYEEPRHPEMVIDTDRVDVEGCAELIIEHLRVAGHIQNRD